jgi:hypothetical protein
MLLQNYERYNSSPYYVNAFAGDKPSALKSYLCSFDVPVELLAIARELARPLFIGRKLYYPNVNAFTEDMLTLQPNQRTGRSALRCGPLTHLHFPWQTNVAIAITSWLQALRVQSIKLGLESLDASFATIVIDDDSAVVAFDVSDVRLKSFLILQHVALDKLSWLCVNYLYAIPNPLPDLTVMTGTIGETVDITAAIEVTAQWLMELSSSLETTHFPSLGAKQTRQGGKSKPRGGKRPQRSYRNTKTDDQPLTDT